MIVYDKFYQQMQAAGQTTYTLSQAGVSPATLGRLRHNKPLSTATIDRLCELLNCQPGDIMERVEK